MWMHRREEERGEDDGGAKSGSIDSNSGTDDERGKSTDVCPTNGDQSQSQAGQSADWQGVKAGRWEEFDSDTEEEEAIRLPSRPSFSFPPAGSPRRGVTRGSWEAETSGHDCDSGSSAGSDRDFLSGTDNGGGSDSDSSDGSTGHSRSGDRHERATSLVQGRYIKGKLIGKGSFGKVYKSYDSHLGRVVAIKTVNLDANVVDSGDDDSYKYVVGDGNDGASWNRAGEATQFKHTQNKFTTAMDALKVETVNDFEDLQKEIQVLAQCRSPYVVQYFTSLVIRHDLWIVMEYLSASVKDIIRYNKQILLGPTTPQAGGVSGNLANSFVGGGFYALPYGASAHSQLNLPLSLILHDVVSALVYLHGILLTHRDIKAANVMLGEDGSVKLTDFGVAGQMSFSSTANIVNKMNSVVGTPFWMAPEVIQQKGYDMSADIWSIGITAIEMAIGSPPHAEMHPMKALMVIPQASPPRLEDYESNSMRASESPGSGAAKLDEHKASPASSGLTFSDSLKDFVATCLQREPSQRPTARELLAHRFLTQKRHHRRARQQLVAIVREFEAFREKNPTRSKAEAKVRASPFRAAGGAYRDKTNASPDRSLEIAEDMNGRADDGVGGVPGVMTVAEVATAGSATVEAFETNPDDEVGRSEELAPTTIDSEELPANATSFDHESAGIDYDETGGTPAAGDWHDCGYEPKVAHDYDSDGSMNTMIIREVYSPSNSNVDMRIAEGRSPTKRRGSFLPVDVIRRFFNVNYDLKPKPSYSKVMETLASSSSAKPQRYIQSAPATPMEAMSCAEGEEGDDGIGIGIGARACVAGIARTTGAKSGHEVGGDLAMVANAGRLGDRPYAKRSLNFTTGSAKSPESSEGGDACVAESHTEKSPKVGDGEGTDVLSPSTVARATPEEAAIIEGSYDDDQVASPVRETASAPARASSRGERRRPASLPIPAVIPVTMTLLILIADTVMVVATRATFVTGAYLLRSSKSILLGLASVGSALCRPIITIGMEIMALSFDVMQSLWIHTMLLALWACQIYVRCILAVIISSMRITSRVAVSLLATWLAIAHMVAIVFEKLQSDVLAHVYEFARMSRHPSPTDDRKPGANK